MPPGGLLLFRRCVSVMHPVPPSMPWRIVADFVKPARRAIFRRTREMAAASIAIPAARGLSPHGRRSADPRALRIERRYTFNDHSAAVKLTSENIDGIVKILHARREQNGAENICYIGNGTATPAIVLTLTSLADDTVVLSAQTVHGYFELHNVNRFVPVEPDEVIFVAEEGERISGLVVGAGGNCSLFANVHRATLTADFSMLEPVLLLAAMQLGLAENVSA